MNDPSSKAERNFRIGPMRTANGTDAVVRGSDGPRVRRRAARTFGPSDPRTFGPSETLGPSDPRTLGPSDRRTFGPSETLGPSDPRTLQCPRMDLRQLEILRAVADTGSFTAAG